MQKIQHLRSPLDSSAEAQLDFWTRLGCQVQEVAALKQQGFVSREVRGGGTVVFKLRYRCGGCQRIKFLGSDAEQAALVAQQLAALQQPRDIDRRLRKFNREAARQLRLSKQTLLPLAEAAGYRFHGSEIRRRRSQGHPGDIAPQK